MIASQLLLAAVVAAPGGRVGVLPVTGSAPVADRARAERAMVEAVEGLNGLSPVAFSSMGAVFGPRAQAALQACTDDACLAAEATALVKVDRLVAGELDAADGLRLRVRLIDPENAAVPVARVSKDVTAANLQPMVAEAVAELFPEQARTSMGIVVLTGGREGAKVAVDGRPVAEMTGSIVSSEPQASLRMAAGRHRIRVTYPGHAPFSKDINVTIGPPVSVEVELDKNRSSGPWILGGAGAALIGAAGLVGLRAQITADEWSDACSSTGCRPGFTRARFETEMSEVDNGRIVANALLIGGGAAIVGALLWYIFDPGSDPEPAEVEP